MSQKQPNVLVFFTDQQRWDTSGLHGNPLDLMPNFDRLARKGTFFTNAFTCQPVCGPARACLQTGKYATTVGTHTNGIALPEDEMTLAKHFRNAGYTTGYIGKWHLAGLKRNPEQGPQKPIPKAKRGGYEYWLASELLEFSSEEYNTVLYDNDDQPVKLPGYRVDACADAAIRYVDAHQHEPFFLFLSLLEPHFQNHRDDFPAPDGYRERYIDGWTPPDLAALGGTAHSHLPGYYGMVKRIDEAFGRLIDALKSLGILENTIVLFTTDHGCHFKTRNAEYKRSCHESSIRLPAAAMGPGFTRGGEVEELVSLVDFPPTLLDAAGLSVPDDMQGRSVMPLLRREEVEWQDDVFVQISESHVGRAVRTKRWKYSVIAPDKHGARDAGADRYVEEFLYDLYADPYELDNLVGRESHRAVADKLRERLIARMVEAGEEAPTIDPPDKTLQAGQRRVLEHEIQE